MVRQVLPLPTEVELSFKGIAPEYTEDSVTWALTTEYYEIVGEYTITVALPNGVTVTRATLVNIITAMNNSANIQKLDIQVTARHEDVAAETTVFNELDCLGLPAADGSTASLIVLAHVGPEGLNIVNAAGTYVLKTKVRQSTVASVKYTNQYALIVAYRSY